MNLRTMILVSRPSGTQVLQSWQADRSTSKATNHTRVCLLSNVSADHPDSYMQRQCEWLSSLEGEVLQYMRQ